MPGHSYEGDPLDGTVQYITERPELEDEADEVEALQDEIRALNGRLDAMNRRLDTLKTLVIGDRETVEDTVQDAPSVWDQLRRLEDEVEVIEETAATAAAVAKDRRADGGETATVDVAKALARDEVVRRCLVDNTVDGDAALSATKVQELARPQHELNNASRPTGSA